MIETYAIIQRNALKVQSRSIDIYIENRITQSVVT